MLDIPRPSISYKFGDAIIHAQYVNIESTEIKNIAREYDDDEETFNIEQSY